MGFGGEDAAELILHVAGMAVTYGDLTAHFSYVTWPVMEKKDGQGPLLMLVEAQSQSLAGGDLSQSHLTGVYEQQGQEECLEGVGEQSGHFEGDGQVNGPEGGRKGTL